MTSSPRPMFSRVQVIWIFSIALALRLAYLALVIAFDAQIDNGSDSGKYIQLASNILEYGAYLNWDLGVLITETGRMPGYPYFVAGIFSIAGPNALWVVSIVQAIIDATTVFAIGLIAGAIRQAWALPAAAISCVWMTMIVYASFVLSDTLFLALFSWGLCACVWAPRSSRPATMLVVAGMLFAAAVYIRLVLLFFPIALIPALAWMLWTKAGGRWWRALALAAIPGAMIMLVLVPRAVVNQAEFGAAVVSTQSGNHALDVVDQILRICPACIDEDLEAKMHAEVTARFNANSEADRKNPIILNQVRREVALEFFKQLPLGAIIRGGVTAALRSVVQTGLYETGQQFDLDPKFFSSIEGPTLIARLSGFASAIVSNPFLFIWSIAQTVAFGAVALQIVGAITGLGQPRFRQHTVFLLAVGGYFLLINGPFGNPRYGMPITPLMVILTVAGGFAILDLRARFARRSAAGSPATAAQTLNLDR